jgi:tRNA threonylcarbamoyladenosine biosynthesis protein TsaE
MKTEFTAISLQELNKVVEAVISLMKVHTIFIIDGQMGSGKTTFVKKICEAMGVRNSVNSPTYSIVNEYVTKENKLIYHFDFYRISNLEEAFDMGVEEYFYSGNLCFIEWAEKVLEALPESFVKISISNKNNTRNYIIEIV